MPRRTFRRPQGDRRYRRLFIIAVEGAKTEPQYFSILNNELSVIHVKCLDSRHKSAPQKVLKRMTDYLKDNQLKEMDEAWLVVDKDQWSDDQLLELYQWANENIARGFALSNPNFEYWLLLHFEDGNRLASHQDCTNRLKRHLPEYNKDISSREMTRARVDDAIRRAKQRDNPACVDWPRNMGITTVYRLVEKILRDV